MTERDVRDKALARIVANEIGLIYSLGTGTIDDADEAVMTLIKAIRAEYRPWWMMGEV